MITVYKYAMRFEGEFGLCRIKMPRASLIVHVGYQGQNVQLWAEVDTEEPDVERIFRVYGTGQPFADGEQGVHVATLMDGPFVWHIFEVTP